MFIGGFFTDKLIFTKQSMDLWKDSEEFCEIEVTVPFIRCRRNSNRKKLANVVFYMVYKSKYKPHEQLSFKIQIFKIKLRIQCKVKKIFKRFPFYISSNTVLTYFEYCNLLKEAYSVAKILFKISYLQKTWLLVNSYLITMVTEKCI